VQSLYQIFNTIENNIGFKLPNGKITIYDDYLTQRTAISKIEESDINKELLIAINEAPEIYVRRRRDSIDIDDDSMIETLYFTVENKTEEESTIEIRQHIYRTNNWKLLSNEGLNDVRMNNNELLVCVTIPAFSTSDFKCQIQYTWDQETEEDRDQPNRKRKGSTSKPKKKEQGFFSSLFS